MRQRLFILLAFGILPGCGNSAPTTAPDLTGSWQSCANLAPKSSRVTMAFSGVNVTLTTEYFYANSTCTGTANQAATIVATYATGTVLADGQGALSLILLTSQRVYGTAGDASTANTNVSCGISTWSTGVALAIDNKTCASDNGATITTVPGSGLLMEYSLENGALKTDYPVYWDGLFRQSSPIGKRLTGIYTFIRI